MKLFLIPLNLAKNYS